MSGAALFHILSQSIMAFSQTVLPMLPISDTDKKIAEAVIGWLQGVLGTIAYYQSPTKSNGSNLGSIK